MLDLTDPLELFAEQTLVPTVFTYGVTGLGKSIDPGSGDRDVKPEASADVPLWLTRPLTKRGMVTFKVPVVYGERHRRKLNAGAECVSLKNLAPYFYEVGNKINEHMQDVELAAFLSRTFKTRYFELVSKGLNTMTGEEVLQLSSKLSVEEQQLFEGGRVSVACIDSWRTGETASRPGLAAGLSRQAQLIRSRKRAAEEAAAAASAPQGQAGAKQARPA